MNNERKIGIDEKWPVDCGEDRQRNSRGEASGGQRPDRDRVVRVCAALCAPTIDAARQMLERARCATADLAELRLDCLEDAAALLDANSAVFAALCALVRERPLPLILTLRPQAEGGRSAFTLFERISFWRQLRAHGAVPEFIDLEFELAEALGTDELDWSRVICSHHDFSGAMKDLATLYERLARTPARVIKIAVTANDALDCLPLFHLLERAQQEQRELIAIAMGTSGIATRLLARGSFLTYASLERGSGTAPGQVWIEELIASYRVRSIERRTPVYGVVGAPIGHSLSPAMHNRALIESGLQGVYVPFETREVRAFVRRLVRPRTREVDWAWRGLSVTAPYKESIIECLDEVDEVAEQTGAVNTVVVRGDELRGYNTDAEGFLAPLRGLLDLDSARAAIIGAGGAARAAAWALRRAGAEVVLFARSPERARPLARPLDVEVAQVVGARFSSFDLVVNATPLGTRGAHEDASPVDAEQLRGARIAYDMVYNPPETLFIRQARQVGCRIVGGLSMLVEQAARQFELWTGRSAPRRAMLEAAQQALGQSATRNH